MARPTRRKTGNTKFTRSTSLGRGRGSGIDASMVELGSMDLGRAKPGPKIKRKVISNNRGGNTRPSGGRVIPIGGMPPIGGGSSSGGSSSGKGGRAGGVVPIGHMPPIGGGSSSQTYSTAVKRPRR